MPLEIEENLTGNLNQMLLHGKLDAIIVALPHEETGLMTRPLYEEAFKVVVPVTHAWAKKRRIDVDSLSGEKVILPHAGHCFRRQVLDQCPVSANPIAKACRGIRWRRSGRWLVASGLGITVLPCSALTGKHQHKRLATVPFADPVPERQIGLAWRKGFPRPQAVGVITDAVRALKIRDLEMAKG